MQNRESIIIKFIHKQWNLLLQNSFSKELYKNEKKSYFYPLKRLVGNPKDTEIARIMLMFMIRKNQIKDNDKLTQILKLSFFKINIRQPKMFHDALKLKKPQTLIIMDHAKLDNIEYLEKIEKEIEKRIRVEQTDSLNQEKEKYLSEIKIAKKNLAAIPTKLEPQNIPEPEQTDSEDKNNKLWWQELNLSEDPFPVAEGLYKIDKNIYDDIIVQTDIFKKYIDIVNTIPSQIYKNTIFYGDFGSGKTAFFNYLSKILIRRKILSIHIPLQASKDNSKNTHNFDYELITRLKEKCNEFDVKINVTAEIPKQEIKNILTGFKEQKAFTGIVIFLDDLHKEQNAFDAVKDFLSSLQIFTTSMMEFGFNIAIYVAGIPQWMNSINKEPRLHGSLIRDESMPDVSIKHAHEMLNKRMITFSKNKNKKNIIGLPFVQKVYDKMKEHHTSITFREFLRIALKEFESGNYDTVLTIDPNSIPSDILSSIKNMILSISKLDYQFEHLLELIADANVENKIACFEFLGIISMEPDNAMYEDEPQLQRNKWSAQQLLRSGLIHYWEDGEKIKWVVSKELITKNKEIIEKHNVSMEDYLVPIFVGKHVNRLTPTISREYEVLQKIYDEMDDPVIKNLLNQTLSQHQKLLDNANTHIQIPPNEIIFDCKKSLSSFTNVFIHIIKISKNNYNDQNILQFWKIFYYVPSALIEFINNIETKNEHDDTAAYYIWGLYNESFANIVSFLEDHINNNKIYEINHEKLTIKECKLFDDLRKLWSNGDHYEMAEIIMKDVENTLRKHIRNILLLLCGNKRNPIYDESIIKIIDSNKEKDKKRGLSITDNELQYFGRKDYKLLMTSGPTQDNECGRRNWNKIFKHIFIGWNEQRLYNYLDVFGDYNTSTSHNNRDSIDHHQQHDIRQFILDTMYIYSKFNDCYVHLLENFVHDSSGYFFTFDHTFRGKPIHIDLESLLEFVQKINIDDELDIDTEPKSLNVFYRIKYREIMMMLAILSKNDNELTTKSDIYLKLINTGIEKFKFKIIKHDMNSS